MDVNLYTQRFDLHYGSGLVIVAAESAEQAQDIALANDDMKFAIEWNCNDIPISVENWKLIENAIYNGEPKFITMESYQE